MQFEPTEKAARILLADDSKINRVFLRMMLEHEDFELLEAANGLEVIEIIQNDSVDLVLLDVVMPEMSGFEACSYIRTQIGNLTLPVIFITSLDDRNSRVKGKEAGGDDFLTKPVDAVELIVRVRNLLKVKAFHDLQERQKEALEEKLEGVKRQLIRSDRLATLGTLAAGVGHELNNISFVFGASLDLIKSNFKNGKLPNEKDLDRLEAVYEHLCTHSSQLLNLGRPGPEHEGTFDLRDVVTSTLSMLHVAGRTKMVKVDLLLPKNPVSVTVNRTRIEQVLINLVGNAADAILTETSRDGMISVSIQSDSPDNRVVCTVANNGPNIPEDKLETIFEPYFTTKSAKAGTGLGLCVVRNIVESYNGTVSVAPRKGGGVIFKFDLPGAL